MPSKPQALDLQLDMELDEALEMTFPASDPVAMAAPGSTSRSPDAPAKPDGSQPELAKPGRARTGRRKA